jgi:ABC-2 type transport system ATP-binding protein
LADRVGVINNGKLIEVGSPDSLGGRNKATATVSWAGGAEETDHPTEVVQRLAAQFGGEVPELTVSGRPWKTYTSR